MAQAKSLKLAAQILEMEKEEGEPALELLALEELIKEFVKFKTGWYANIVAAVRRTAKWKYMRLKGRLSLVELQGILSPKALRMYATKIKNEQKDELLKTLKASNKQKLLAHCCPTLSARRPLELLGHNTWASIASKRWFTSEHSLQVETFGQHSRLGKKVSISKRMVSMTHR